MLQYYHIVSRIDPILIPIIQLLLCFQFQVLAIQAPALEFLPHNVSHIHSCFLFIHSSQHLLPYNLVNWRSNFSFDQNIKKVVEFAWETSNSHLSLDSDKLSLLKVTVLNLILVSLFWLMISAAVMKALMILLHYWLNSSLGSSFQVELATVPALYES